ncbi:hypothetical protein [Aeromonas sp.]|nr:hypothetical protein [Aeromonas sp.]MCX7132310.1 hypothetical protein [Aeromonas sp.]
MRDKLHHHRGMVQDRNAKPKLQQRQKKRDEIERRQLANQLGIDPKEVR